MIILILFAFLAGIVTILSPCILPVIPIVLSTGITEDREFRRPVGVITGFITSFTFFTLFLSSLVKISGISADFLRILSVFVILIFGFTLIIPSFMKLFETVSSKIAGVFPVSSKRNGFWGGLLIGVSLGLIWTPCVGPILASIIALAITGSISGQAVLITLSYSFGTAIPMFIIMIGGRALLTKFPSLTSNTMSIQKIFGVLMILTALMIAFNLDRKFQSFILNKFPAYGANLTKIEDNQLVKKELNKIKGGETNPQINAGQSMFNLLDPKYVRAPDIIPGGKWFNSEPLTLDGLRGKVVLIDFWTYTCINCQRTLPYLRNWWDTYKDMGLVIIGVHSPEFEFEKNPDNVEGAIKDFNLKYPIVQDNNFDTWRAYNNHYWPAKYLIDKDGYIRYSHFGEGNYDESEGVIQELLKETGIIRKTPEVKNQEYQVYAQTPETYLGSDRLANFASPEKITVDKLSVYSIPDNIPSNFVAYGGGWLLTPQYAKPAAGSKLKINFEAKEVFLVMRTTAGQSEIKVSVNGQIKTGGSDVKEGIVTVREDRLYKLVNQDAPERQILELEFTDDKVELYAFTFG